MPETHRDEIEKLEALYASNPAGRVFTHLAEAYRKAGELARAREILDGGLTRHPDYPSAYVVLGRVLLDLGEADEAAAAFRRVLELDRHNLVALRALGDMAVEAGLFEEARHYFGELILIDPADLETAERLETLPEEPAFADILSEPEWSEPEAAESGEERGSSEAAAGAEGPEAAAAEPGDAVEEAAGTEDALAEEPAETPREPAPLAAWVETLSVLDADVELPELPPMEPAPPMTWPDPVESAAATSPEDDVDEDALGPVGSDVEAPTEPVIEAEPEREADVEAAAWPEFAVEPEAWAGSQAAPELELDTELEFEAELETEPELEVEPELEAEPESGTGAWPEPAPEVETAPELEATPEFEPTPALEAEAEPEPEVDSEVVAEPPAMVSDAILEPEEPETDTGAAEPEVASGTEAGGELTVAEADLALAWWGDPELHGSVPEPVEWVSQEDWAQIAAYGTWAGMDEAEDAAKEAVPPVEDDWGSERDEDADEVATETLAEVYAAQGFRAEAAEIYRKLLRRRPEDERLLSRLAALEKEPVGGTAEVAAAEVTAEEEAAGDLWLEDGETWPGGEEQAEAGPTPYAWMESGGPVEVESGGTIGDRLRGILGWQPEAAPVDDREPEPEAEAEATLLLEDVAAEPVLPDFPVFGAGSPPAEAGRSGRDTEGEEDLEMFRSWLKSLRK